MKEPDMRNFANYVLHRPDGSYWYKRNAPKGRPEMITHETLLHRIGLF